jgi:DNA-directed RNA polymerase subunit RPC12/RpoP
MREIQAVEATRYDSERVTRVVITSWICPRCGKANEEENLIGNYPKCERCEERTVLVRRVAQESTE